MEKSVGGKWSRTWTDFNSVAPTFQVEWAMKPPVKLEGGRGRGLLY